MLRRVRARVATARLAFTTVWRAAAMCLRSLVAVRYLLVYLNLPISGRSQGPAPTRIFCGEKFLVRISVSHRSQNP